MLPKLTSSACFSLCFCDGSDKNNPFPVLQRITRMDVWEVLWLPHLSNRYCIYVKAWLVILAAPPVADSAGFHVFPPSLRHRQPCRDRRRAEMRHRGAMPGRFLTRALLLHDINRHGSKSYAESDGLRDIVVGREQ